MNGVKRNRSKEVNRVVRIEACGSRALVLVFVRDRTPVLRVRCARGALAVCSQQVPVLVRLGREAQQTGAAPERLEARVRQQMALQRTRPGERARTERTDNALRGVRVRVPARNSHSSWPHSL